MKNKLIEKIKNKSVEIDKKEENIVAEVNSSIKNKSEAS